MKKIYSILAATVLFVATSSTIHAQDEGAKEFAAYSAGLGISPFGPSLNFSHNLSEKTTVNVGIGAFSGDNPVAQEIGGATFDGTAATNWMGIFLNHRPFEDYDWLRFYQISMGHQ